VAVFKTEKMAVRVKSGVGGTKGVGAPLPKRAHPGRINARNKAKKANFIFLGIIGISPLSRESFWEMRRI
jgi:hypothetical protein